MTADSEPKKKTYARPELKRIRLVPEEAILAGCKINRGTGPHGRNCRQTGPCVQQGT